MRKAFPVEGAGRCLDEARALHKRQGPALLPLLLALLLLAARPAAAGDPTALGPGAYLFAVAGCAACHTDTQHKGPLLAGGPPLATPFGTFYGPNITPDRTYGIGAWSDADFVRALREGMRPD